jgi:putative transcriptional regulator
MLYNRPVTKPMTTHITNTLKAKRQEKQLTQEALATALNVSRQTIIALEQGRYEPSLSLAFRLSAFFETPIESLFTLSA